MVQGYMRIYFRSADLGVSQVLLDDAHVDLVAQHMCGYRMPEHMRVNVLLHLGLFANFAQREADVGNRFAVRIFWSDFFAPVPEDVFVRVGYFQRLDGPDQDVGRRQDLFFAAFLRHFDRFAREIEMP